MRSDWEDLRNIWNTLTYGFVESFGVQDRRGALLLCASFALAVPPTVVLFYWLGWLAFDGWPVFGDGGLAVMPLYSGPLGLGLFYPFHYIAFGEILVLSAVVACNWFRQGEWDKGLAAVSCAILMLPLLLGTYCLHERAIRFAGLEKRFRPFVAWVCEQAPALTSTEKSLNLTHYTRADFPAEMIQSPIVVVMGDPSNSLWPQCMRPRFPIAPGPDSVRTVLYLTTSTGGITWGEHSATASASVDCYVLAVSNAGLNPLCVVSISKEAEKAYGAPGYAPTAHPPYHLFLGWLHSAVRRRQHVSPSPAMSGT